MKYLVSGLKNEMVERLEVCPTFRAVERLQQDIFRLRRLMKPDLSFDKSFKQKLLYPKTLTYSTLNEYYVRFSYSNETRIRRKWVKRISILYISGIYKTCFLLQTYLNIAISCLEKWWPRKLITNQLNVYHP